MLQDYKYSPQRVRHESILHAVRLLGIGTHAITYVATDEAGRMDSRALADVLRESSDVATIVCFQARDLNTGVYDCFEEICPMARSANAWVHIDGAFGLWAAASPKYRHLLKGADKAELVGY